MYKNYSDRALYTNRMTLTIAVYIILLDVRLFSVTTCVYLPTTTEHRLRTFIYDWHMYAPSCSEPTDELDDMLYVQI